MLRLYIKSFENNVHDILHKEINNALLKCWFPSTTTLIEHLLKEQLLQTLGKGQRIIQVLCFWIHSEILGY